MSRPWRRSFSTVSTWLLSLSHATKPPVLAEACRPRCGNGQAKRTCVP
jgi:hypothetical protein